MGKFLAMYQDLGSENLHLLQNVISIDFNFKDIVEQQICPGFVNNPLTDLNNFDMPFQVSTKEASTAIQNGLKKANQRFTSLNGSPSL